MRIHRLAGISMLTGLVLLAAGCGGGPTSTPQSTTRAFVHDFMAGHLTAASRLTTKPAVADRWLRQTYQGLSSLYATPYHLLGKLPTTVKCSVKHGLHACDATFPTIGGGTPYRSDFGQCPRRVAGVRHQDRDLRTRPLTPAAGATARRLRLSFDPAAAAPDV